jgi:hypothetical protein
MFVISTHWKQKFRSFEIQNYRRLLNQGFFWGVWCGGGMRSLFCGKENWGAKHATTHLPHTHTLILHFSHSDNSVISENLGRRTSKMAKRQGLAKMLIFVGVEKVNFSSDCHKLFSETKSNRNRTFFLESILTWNQGRNKWNWHGLFLRTSEIEMSKRNWLSWVKSNCQSEIDFLE